MINFSLFRYKDFRRFLPRFVMVNLVQHLALMLVKQKTLIQILGVLGLYLVVLILRQLVLLEVHQHYQVQHREQVLELGARGVRSL